jgi:hypothetical protein
MYETFSERPIVPYYQWGLHLSIEKTSKFSISIPHSTLEEEKAEEQATEEEAEEEEDDDDEEDEEEDKEEEGNRAERRKA